MNCPLDVPNRHQEQIHHQHIYIWGCYHTIKSHILYIRKGTTSTVYFICKCRTNTTGSILRDTRRSRRQRSINKKVTKVNESKQCMERGLQEEPVKYVVSMPSGRSNTLNKLPQTLIIATNVP